jgi:hypothetical protein
VSEAEGTAIVVPNFWENEEYASYSEAEWLLSIMGESAVTLTNKPPERTNRTQSRCLGDRLEQHQITMSVGEA